MNVILFCASLGIPLLKAISQCFEEWGCPGSLRLRLSPSAIFISSGSPMATQSFNFAKQQTGTLGIIRHTRFLSQQIEQRFTIRFSTALYLCLTPLWQALFHSRKSFEYLGPDKRMRISTDGRINGTPFLPLRNVQPKLKGETWTVNPHNRWATVWQKIELLKLSERKPSYIAWTWIFKLELIKVVFRLSPPPSFSPVDCTDKKAWAINHPFVCQST